MGKLLREGHKDYSSLAYLYCRPLFKIGLNTFYGRIQMQNPEVFEKDVATVVVSNHSNAFIDPVSMAIHFNFKGFYMARGDAFKNKLIASFLWGIGILPIFRMSDAGRQGVLKNNVSFQAFSNHLKRGKLIQIFPEAICVWEKKMRSIKKGTARMVLNYMKAAGKTNLKIQPIGLNYSCASKFGSDLFINAGTPIDAGLYLDVFLKDEQEGMIQLTKAIENQISPLMIQVENEEEDVFNILEVILKNENGGNDLAVHFQRSKALGIWMNQQSQTNLNWHAFKHRVTAYNQMLKRNYFRDHLFTRTSLSKLKFTSVVLKCLGLIFGMPFFLIGSILNGLPYLVVVNFVKRKVKERIFEASAKILLGSMLFQLNWLLLFFITWWLSSNFWYALAVLFTAIFTGWWSIHFMKYMKKSLGFIKLYFQKKSSIAVEVINFRQAIVSTLNASNLN